MTKQKKNEEVPTTIPEEAPNAAGKVGYGNPSEHSKFKKGNKMSKGRKKGSKGMKRMVNEAYGKKVSVKENGKARRKMRSEVGLDQLANRFAQGDPRATEKSLQLLERYGPQDDLEGPSPERVEANLDALRSYLGLHDQLTSMDGGDNDD